jgi:hypothetical protein
MDDLDLLTANRAAIHEAIDRSLAAADFWQGIAWHVEATRRADKLFLIDPAIIDDLRSLGLYPTE